MRVRIRVRVKVRVSSNAARIGEVLAKLRQLRPTTAPLGRIGGRRKKALPTWNVSERRIHTHAIAADGSARALAPA